MDNKMQSMDHTEDKTSVLLIVSKYFVMSVNLMDEFRLMYLVLGRLYDMMEDLVDTCSTVVLDGGKMELLMNAHKMDDELTKFAYSIVAFLDDSDDAENDLVQILVQPNHVFANLNKETLTRGNEFRIVTYNVLCHSFLVLL